MQKIIYVYGLDGSGKSTLCTEIVKYFQNENTEVSYQWMRFNHFFSKIINALGRFSGLSYIESYSDGTKIGYHDYHKSWVIRWSYCLTTLLDSSIAGLFSLRLSMMWKPRIIVVDRFAVDTLIDLVVDTREERWLKNWVGKILINCLPQKNVLPVFVDTQIDNIKSRRTDIQWDKHFEKKSELYHKFFDFYHMGIKVDNNGDIGNCLKNIIVKIKSNEEKSN